ADAGVHGAGRLGLRRGAERDLDATWRNEAAWADTHRPADLDRSGDRRGSARSARAGALLSSVAPLEAGHASLRVHRAGLAGVEGVTLRGDLDVHHGVRPAVVPFDGLVAARRRPGQEGVSRGPVTEDHRVVVGVFVLLHDRSSWAWLSTAAPVPG